VFTSVSSVVKERESIACPEAMQSASGLPFLYLTTEDTVVCTDVKEKFLCFLCVYLCFLCGKRKGEYSLPRGDAICVGVAFFYIKPQRTRWFAQR